MSFNPKFEWVNRPNVEDIFIEVADKINRPHEDYPRRIPATLRVIKDLIVNRYDFFNSFDARQVHAHIFPNLSFSGKWRECNVLIGKETPPHFLQVPDLIENIFPICREKMNLIDWYKKFQTIHPFQDGNGRVGGVIVAVLSWDGNKMLAPLQ